MARQGNPRAVIAIDPINSRIVAEYDYRGIVRRVERYHFHDEPLLSTLDELLQEFPSILRKTIAVGVYPGPGPFSRMRKAVLIAHLVSRYQFGSAQVRIVPLRAFDQPLLRGWHRAPIQQRVTVRYGKEPNIQRSEVRNQ